MPFSNPALSIAPYSKEMNAQLQLLETSSQDTKKLCRLIKANRNFAITYDELIEYKYQSGFILVCLLNKEKVVAKVAIGIKEVIFNQKSAIAAYVFDLRVDANYQR